MRYAILILLICAFSSCATIFNRKTYEMQFESNRENASVSINDSTYKLPAKVKVTRARKNLDVRFASDSIKKDIVLYPTNDRKMILNLIAMQLAPVALAVDYSSPQHYTYGKKVTFTFYDSLTVTNSSTRSLRGRPWQNAKRYFNNDYPGGKGRINFVVGTPVANSIFIDNPYTHDNFWSFGGLTLGAEYFYSDNRYLSFSTGYLLPNEDIVPMEDFGPFKYEEASAFFASLTNNVAFSRFSIGYGINYTWSRLRAVDENVDFDEQFDSNLLGLSADLQYRIVQKFFAGVYYKPTLYRFSPDPKSTYAHTLTFGLSYKIPLCKSLK